MMDILGLLELQGRLFLLMGVGMFLRWSLLSEAFQKGLTDLIVDLILPCSILTAFGTEPREDLLRSVLFTLVLSTIIQIGCALIAAALFRRSPANRRPVLSYGTICSNAGFLGTPVAESVFGPEGVLLASVFLIPQRAFMWTLGVSYFTKGGGHGWKKVLTNPCILAVLAGTALWAARMDLPPVLDGAVRSLGSCNTGLSMLLIGMLMSGFHWRDLADPGILCFCGVRLVLIPFLTLAGCRIFHAEALASQVSLLLTAMPAAGTTAVLAAKYGGDAEFAAGCITASTFLSMITIPLWCAAAL